MKNSEPVDHTFIAKLKEIVLENISNEDFGVEELADATAMSRTSLYRRVKSMTGHNVRELIRKVRLQKAQELLMDELITASEVAYKVGFSSPAYFSKCFSEYYGYPPGEARKKAI